MAPLAGNLYQTSKHSLRRSSPWFKDSLRCPLLSSWVEKLVQCKFLHYVDYDLVYAAQCIYIAILRPTFSLRPSHNARKHYHSPAPPMFIIDLMVHQLTSHSPISAQQAFLQNLNSVVQGGLAMNKFCSFPRGLLGVRSSKLRRSIGWMVG